MPEDLNALDRELSELLAVEPSPEFAARVRTRIEQQPAASFAWRWWLGAAVVGAAAIAIAVAAGARRTPVVQPAVPVHQDVRLPPIVRPDPPVMPPPDDSPRRSGPGRRHERIAVAEVLIDPSLAAAVRRLTTEQRVLPEVPPAPSLTPVVVEPLKVPDISDSGTKQGS
jgi:hypothetical protein